MNFVLVALILDLLCSTVVWATKLDRPLRQETEDVKFLSSQYYVSPEHKCHYQLFGCDYNWRKYVESNYIRGEAPGSNLLRNVYNAGARVVCGDIRSMLECILETWFTNPDCLRDYPERDSVDGRGQPPLPIFWQRYTSIDPELFVTVNSTCSKHLSAIEQHWDCLINEDRIRDLIYCGRKPKVPGMCENFEPQIECSVKVIESSPSCEAGSSQLIQEIQKKLLPASIGCLVEESEEE